MERDFLGLNWKDSTKMVEEKKLSHDLGLQWSDSLKPTTQANGQRKLADDIQSALCFAVSNNFDLNSKPPPLTQGSSNSSKFLPGTNNENYNNMAIAKPVLNIFPASDSSDVFDNTPPYQRSSTSLSSGLLGTLTITYSGAVHVFHDISPEKVKAIMKMAGNEYFNMAETVTLTEQTRAEDVNRNLQQINGIRSPLASTTFIIGVPLARKATLARFLEKRKNRLKAFKLYNTVERRQRCTTFQANETTQCYPFMPEEGTASSRLN